MPAARGPMVEVSLSIEGEAVLVRRLRAIDARADDPSPAWPHVLEVVRKQAARAFKTEGKSTDRGAWAELAPSTQRERAAQGYRPAHPILKRTGRLERSLTMSGAEGFVESHRRSQLLFGSRVPYFPYHQSPQPRSKLPRRALTFTPAQRNAIMLPVRRYITGHDPGAPVRRRPSRSR